MAKSILSGALIGITACFFVVSNGEVSMDEQTCLAGTNCYTESKEDTTELTSTGKLNADGLLQRELDRKQSSLELTETKAQPHTECGAGAYNRGEGKCAICHGMVRRRRLALTCTPCAAGHVSTGGDECQADPCAHCYQRDGSGISASTGGCIPWSADGSQCVTPDSTSQYCSSDQIGTRCAAQDVPSIRLVDLAGNQVVQEDTGVLQIYANGIWKYVCDDWARQGEVACGELNMAFVSQASTREAGLQSINWQQFRTETANQDLFYDVTCDGSEARLHDCPSKDASCSTLEAVYLSCQGCIDVSGTYARKDGSIEVLEQTDRCTGTNWGGFTVRNTVITIKNGAEGDVNGVPGSYLIDWRNSDSTLEQQTTCSANNNCPNGKLVCSNGICKDTAGIDGDSCNWANDGVCDEPGMGDEDSCDCCAEHTDMTDCGRAQEITPTPTPMPTQDFAVCKSKDGSSWSDNKCKSRCNKSSCEEKHAIIAGPCSSDKKTKFLPPICKSHRICKKKCNPFCNCVGFSALD